MSRISLNKFAILPAIALAAGTAFADAADDCIADYESMKTQFENASIDADYVCIRTGNSLALFGTGTSPLECIGEGEWHLEAKAHGGNNGRCSIRILGSAGAECEADLIERDLSPSEAAKWRNRVASECR